MMMYSSGGGGAFGGGRGAFGGAAGAGGGGCCGGGCAACGFSPQGCARCGGAGGEMTACGASCGGGGPGSGAMSYVGPGSGQYRQETTYKYVGCGGDFDVVRPRRDFTCIITSCCLLSLLLLIPLLCWLLSGLTTSLPYDCEAGMGNLKLIENTWSQAQKDY